MKLDHIALNVENIEISTSWYKDNLGVEVLYQDETWAMLSTGKTKIALTVRSQHPPHLGFALESLDKLPSDTVKYHRDGSAYCYVSDPDGNVIEFLYYPQ